MVDGVLSAVGLQDLGLGGLTSDLKGGGLLGQDLESLDLDLEGLIGEPMPSSAEEDKV
jgi:hypothetical protein